MGDGKKRKQHIARRLPLPYHCKHRNTRSSSGSVAQNTIMKVASEIAFQSLHPGIGASSHNECAFAVLEEAGLHLEFFQRDVAGGMRPVLEVSFLTWSQRAVRRYSQLRKHPNKVYLVIGLGLYSSSIQGVYHDALWLALLNEVCQPAAHAPIRSVFDLMTMSDKKLMVEPSATVGLDLNSAVIHDVSCDSLFTALEFSASNTVVGQA